VPGPGVVVEGITEAFKAARNRQKRRKKGGFVQVLAYKLPKTPFFAQKYLTRYTHETFFEKYTNFEAHYLSHCRVIPLQSCGSCIRPQPHGFGLTMDDSSLGGFQREDIIY
jgi:hypothetical protein